MATPMIPIEIGTRTFWFPGSFDDLPQGALADYLAGDDRYPLPDLQASRIAQYLGPEGPTPAQMLGLVDLLKVCVDDPEAWESVVTSDGPDKPGIDGQKVIAQRLLATWQERDRTA